MNTIKLYLRSMGMLLKCQLQYPASFFIQTLAQLVMEGGELMALILLIDRFQQLNQWTAGNLFFFFGIMSVTFYLTEIFGRGITGAFPGMVRTGQLDTLLLRPRGVLTQVLCSAIDPRRITCIAVGVTAMVIGSRLSDVHWTWIKAAMLAEAVLMGGLLILGLFMIEAVFCIYSVKSVELVNVLTYGGRSTCEYPADIYPRPLRMLFTTVAPFVLVLQFPASCILDKPLFNWSVGLAFLTPLSGAVSFAIIYAVFRWAMRYYRSTGS